MGNVLQGGGAGARASGRDSRGVARRDPAMTTQQVCGSGLKAVRLAAQAIKAGDSNSW